ncbi:MAG: hypothetical protein COB36_03325 [Alphaproteobacteria bacterium]|nr:MAG: hypothetical protein COB36_03325 [Alphaproteobacteria bacterium]
MAPKLFNVSLRMGSLAIKMLLMLYMGRYLGLYELGTYGLIAAYVALSIPLFGMRLEYTISREIVGLPPSELVIKLRDEFLFYIFNYMFLIVGCLLWVLLLSPDLGLKIIFFTVILCILEGLSTLACSNFVALGRPILSNFIFFLRSSIWVIPAIALGLYDPSFRTVETIIVLWLSGVILSLLMTAYVWRELPWRETLSIPFDTRLLYLNLKKIYPLWISEISMVAAININRFVVEYYLDREFVGIISFYGAFTVAISSLLASGIFAFALPKMITLQKEKAFTELIVLTKSITVHAIISAIMLSLVIGIAIPILGDFMERPEFREHALVLWLMLIATCLTLLTASLQHLSYARHQDWAIWGGNYILLVLSATLNIMMVPIFGFVGVGYSAVLCAIIHGVWRVYSAFTYHHKSNKHQ